MDYGLSNAGKVKSGASGSGSFLPFEEVEERLIDTLQLWWRLPDADDRFGLRGRISSIWNQFVPERALIDAVTEEPRALPPSRADIARMMEATEWVTLIPEADRRVVLMGLAYLARGHKQVPWLRMMRSLGIKRGAHGLRKRYDRGLAALTSQLNGVPATRAVAESRRNPGRWRVNTVGNEGRK